MAGILPNDLGRIYAYIWKDHKVGIRGLKERFERDPTSVIKEVAVDLGIKDFDRLMDVTDPLADSTNPPTDYTSAQLQQIIEGKDKNYTIIFRMTC